MLVLLNIFVNLDLVQREFQDLDYTETLAISDPLSVST